MDNKKTSCKSWALWLTFDALGVRVGEPADDLLAGVHVAHAHELHAGGGVRRRLVDEAVVLRRMEGEAAKTDRCRARVRVQIAHKSILSEYLFLIVFVETSILV